MSRILAATSDKSSSLYLPVGLRRHSAIANRRSAHASIKKRRDAAGRRTQEPTATRLVSPPPKKAIILPQSGDGNPTRKRRFGTHRSAPLTLLVEGVEFLGIDRLPVVDDGSQSRNVEWKPATAHAIAKAALDAGREVFWIEDFYGILPTNAMPEGVVFIDTATDPDGAVLAEDMLPARLRPLHLSTSSV